MAFLRRRRNHVKRKPQRSAAVSVEVHRIRRAKKRTRRAVTNQHDVFRVTGRGRLVHAGTFAGGAAAALAADRLLRLRQAQQRRG